MKYEFIHSMRTFLISYVVFLAMCVIYPFLADKFFFPNIPFLYMFFNLGFILLVIGIIIALFVSLFINFHHSMFKKPAYLTLTLPVSSTQLVLSKVIMSIVWLIIGIFVLMIGLFIMTMITSFINDVITISELFDTLKEMLGSVIHYFIYDSKDFFKDILAMMSGLIFMIGSIYFALTSAHTKWLRKHRLIFGIILYITIDIIVAYIGSDLFTSSAINSDILAILQSLYYLSLGSFMIFGTIYIFDHYIEID